MGNDKELSGMLDDLASSMRKAELAALSLGVSASELRERFDRLLADANKPQFEYVEEPCEVGTALRVFDPSGKDIGVARSTVTAPSMNVERSIVRAYVAALLNVAEDLVWAGPRFSANGLCA